MQRRGNAPSKDVGGPGGFSDFPGTILDAADEERRALLDRYGGPFDPSGPGGVRARLGMPGSIRAFPCAILSLAARGGSSPGADRIDSTPHDDRRIIRIPHHRIPGARSSGRVTERALPLEPPGVDGNGNG